MMERVVARFPNMKIVATTLREVHSTSRHAWGAVAWIGGETHVSPTCELDVFDRVGGGDGFASGFFYGLLSGASPDEAVRLGWAHGALLTTFPGDTTMATLDQVRAFAKGGSARIRGKVFLFFSCGCMGDGWGEGVVASFFLPYTITLFFIRTGG